ncbi:hypothetical protein [Halomonas sp.]|uniref:hypothetical protein n=1 Tax=Halomonas sp. TaxID=1486246 RepID=UPI0035613060
MEHGIITSTRYENGVILCDVQAIRVNTEYPDVPMLKPFSAFTVVPSIGQKVGMVKLSDGKRFITGVMAAEGEGVQPASMEQGEVALQLDEATRLTFSKNSSGGYDIELSASGQITLNADGDVDLTAGGQVSLDGVPFDTHTHDYTWDDTAGSGTTDPPQ